MDSLILLLYSKRSNGIFVPDLQLSWICFRVVHILCWGGVLVWEWKDPGSLKKRRRFVYGFTRGVWEIVLESFFKSCFHVLFKCSLPFFPLVSNYQLELIWLGSGFVQCLLYLVSSLQIKVPPPALFFFFFFLVLLPSRGGLLIVILWGRNSGVVHPQGTETNIISSCLGLGQL